MTFDFLRLRRAQRVDQLKQLVVMDRQMTSLMDRAFLSVGPHLVRDQSNWVGCWMDTGYRVGADTGDIEAVRAVTDAGQLIWMVRHPDKTFGYHADANDPFAAMAQARCAWARRREIKSRWAEVKALRREVIAGRRKLVVHIDDARDAGLCDLGIRGFLRALGQGARVQMPGRVLAVLSYFEKQAAYALWAAHVRTSDASFAQNDQLGLHPAE